MKKVLAILLALTLGLAPVSFAAETLTNAELDEVAAGDWVVITEGQEVVDGIHYSNNDINLEDESQMEIQAVSNANVVDSAVAVQSNIASVEGEPSQNVAVNGSNEANIINYNPSDAGSESSSSSYSKSISAEASSGFNFDLDASSSSSSGSKYNSTETLDIVETLDIAAAFAAAGESESKSEESEYVAAGALVVDYDYTLDYDKNKSKETWSEADASLSITKSGYETASFSADKTKTESRSSSYRKNLSENNHIDLEDTSQRLIQAVSNLNSVGSGVAVQNNIASNVGVSGTITHTNVATVVNGL